MALNYKPNDILCTAEVAVNDNSCFVDPSLKGYHFIDPHNPSAEWDVQYGKGTFCFSFAIKKGEQLKCLRVWKDDNLRLKGLDHIKRVCDCFNQYKIDYVRGYSYIERAVKLNNGVVIPAVLMDWVNGSILIDYVRDNYRNSTTIRQLANCFFSMCQYHKKYSMAHGDLSAGNIIVQPGGDICFIDYDSFYFHEFGFSIPEYTKGTPGYQHHERLNSKTPKNIDSSTDYFSQIVIYLSLIAIAAEPKLFEPLSDECLLFQGGDLQSQENFLNSTIYKKVLAIKNEEVQQLLRELVKSLGCSLAEVRSLVDLKSEPIVLPAIKASYCGKCGYHFSNQTDGYCPMCGTKREELK
jgi:serine/threonine protein kinase